MEAMAPKCCETAFVLFTYTIVAAYTKGRFSNLKIFLVVLMTRD